MRTASTPATKHRDRSLSPSPGGGDGVVRGPAIGGLEDAVCHY